MRTYVLVRLRRIMVSPSTSRFCEPRLNLLATHEWLNVSKMNDERYRRAPSCQSACDN